MYRLTKIMCIVIHIAGSPSCSPQNFLNAKNCICTEKRDQNYYILHIIAYLWSLGEPSNTVWVTIRNCESVDLDMSCTSYRRPFYSLTIENVTNLRFIRSVTTIKNPAKLVLRNIKNIEVIPENTFTLPYRVKYTGEAKHHELQEIEFENVHIGTIEGHAFHNLRCFRNFTWRKVDVDRIHANAIKIVFNTTHPSRGKFFMTNSTVEIAEYLSFQLYVKKATFQKNKFVEIMSGEKREIGQSGRIFEIRMRKHLRSHQMKKSNSTFANHCIENQHNFNNSFEILHIAEKGLKFDFLEGPQIIRYNKSEFRKMVSQKYTVSNRKIFSKIYKNYLLTKEYFMDTVKYNGEAKHHELQEIEFENVHIGTIDGHAFHNLRGFKNLTWRNVDVDRIHANAIKIAFNTTYPSRGKFFMTNSTVEIAEYLSFQLHVKEATFRKNKFVEIMSGGINGTIETFSLVNNKINTLQAGSISILSKTVTILDNTFNYLKSGCFEKISPGLLVDSHTSFRNLEFIYKFNNNNIINLDAGSLNPDMNAYRKVSADFIFSFYTFIFTCENIGWLMSKIRHGYNSVVALQEFYGIITDDNGSNIYSGLSCRRPIGSIEDLLQNRQCNSGLSMEIFCRPTTTDKSESTFEKHYSDELFSMTLINRTDLLRSGGNNLFHKLLLLLLLTVIVNITRIS